jgi:hypothetical protein
MTMPPKSHKLLPEQAKTIIAESLSSLSKDALNELVFFVEFLKFREKAMNELNSGSIEPTDREDYDISKFAGMLSDLTQEEMQHFDESTKRRPLFVERKVDL